MVCYSSIWNVVFFLSFPFVFYFYGNAKGLSELQYLIIMLGRGDRVGKGEGGGATCLKKVLFCHVSGHTEHCRYEFQTKYGSK